MLRAILFDLDGTLAYVKEPVKLDEVSEYLVRNGYEVYPQALKATLLFVSMIDYPKMGFKDIKSYYRQVLLRLGFRIDEETLTGIARLYEGRMYVLYPDARRALVMAKQMGLKTAIVTSIAKFWFEDAVRPIERYLDVIVTGYEAGCEKSNPRMYERTLELLDARPAEAVMVGDDLNLDVILPKKLGMRAILLDRSGAHGESSYPDAVVRNLIEAMEVMRSWMKAER